MRQHITTNTPTVRADGTQPIHIVVAKRLIASSVRQTRPVAHGVIEVVGLIDLCRSGGELMENIRHLTRGIVAEASCELIAEHFISGTE